MSEGRVPGSEKGRLDAGKVTVVYTMFHHLGDFVVMGGLLKKFDQLGVGFESIIAHRGSPHVATFDGKTEGRFFDVGRTIGFFGLCGKLREQKRAGRLILGIPMAPGSVQAFGFFWALKRLGALTHIVDFNLINADILTPPRRRYIFDRHLAQTAEIFKRPDWLEDVRLPLAIKAPLAKASRRIGIFPWSGRGHLREFQWPDSRWIEVTERILESFDGDVVLLGRDDSFNKFERTLREGLSENLKGRFIARPAASVPDLVTSLREVEGLLTLNTAALHLAHALELPMVALCGSSAECWLPEASNVQLVRDETGILPPSDNATHDPLQPSLQNIGVEEVHHAVAEHLLKRKA